MVDVMAELRCSFCGKPEGQVTRLIAGPGVYICDECVDLCQEILNEDPGDEQQSAASTHPGGMSPAGNEQAADPLNDEALRERLANLADRERRVLELRYGLSGEQPRTLDEVGQTLQLAPEQVRQIENESLKKLR